MGNMVPHGDRLHECAIGCPEWNTPSPQGPEEIDEVKEYRLSQEQMDAIEHLVEHYAAMLGSLAIGTMSIPRAERHAMVEELKHIEETLHAVTSVLFPERHAVAMRMKEEALRKMTGGLN
jgi:hypothetical protein